ncbi:hypothetical protein [Nitrosopumilus sp. Nsub]|uniref:hypothetical protein n=1 Tax=Nitrosopumilus sp. Nsub TaxID=1776294 RepID=UPI00155F3F6F|nr:hypothetical protein [Nitrosopumilus sp. Nsub]
MASIALAFYIGFLVSSFENEKQFEITTDRELSLALNDLRDRIKEKIPITVDHVLFLANENVERFYVLEPNKMIDRTYSQNYQEHYDTFFYENGTRSFVEKQKDGAILKEIVIHDNPKNPVMILILED